MTGMTAGAPLVKICGLKDTATIRAMTGLPVDYIGFVFAASKRQVTPEQAAALREAALSAPMRGGRPPHTVGVFVDPSLEALAEALEQVPLDVVQLHGRESAAFCREVGDRFGVQVWRALSVQEELPDRAPDASGAARIAAYEGAVSAVLIDTAGGGTGRAFRWELIPAYREAARRHRLQLFVAGGLTPDNAAALVSDYRPDGVDVSSGVETDGVKDILKIASFAERVNRS